jgi:S1-C subfamily serine protease
MHRLLLPFILFLSLFHGPTYTQVVEKAQSSVVRLTGTMEEAHYSCTGFVIRVHRVLTAAHCKGENMTADRIPVTVLRANTDTDLMLLDVDTNKPALKFRDLPVVRFENLTAIGYGFGWPYLTVLNVRALLVDVSPESDLTPGLIVQGGYIHGMSGGPVIDSVGQVVGIVQQTNEGVGYGVTVTIIKAFLLGS